MAGDDGGVKRRWTFDSHSAYLRALRLETDLADGTAGGTGVTASRGLTYPVAGIPGPGEALTVAPGVLWMRLPLPMTLNHVNVYAIADGEGWVVVDAGLRTRASMEAWEIALEGPLDGKPITRVICTHMHPDHIGLAGWLCERFDAPLLMSRLEYVTGRMLLADTGKPAPQLGERFYRAAGWTEAQIETWRQGYGGFGKAVAELPAGYRRLCEDDRLAIGGEEWRVVIGEGHSPEHVCLWREADGVFLAGDQILPRISSNVSVWPTEPEGDPLGEWMRSLERLRGFLPGDLFVLPSHGEPFTGVTTRLDALLKGHEIALKRLERTLRKPCRAVDVFPALFARSVGDEVLGMATGEAVAHLNYLARQGRAAKHRDETGVDWWIASENQA